MLFVLGLGAFPLASNPDGLIVDFCGGITSRQDTLLNAAERGNLELVEALIKSATDLECIDYRGRTPLLSGSSRVTLTY